MTGLRRFPPIKRCGEGMASALEFVFAFHDWALVNSVTVESIRSRWGVSRATAYRYLNAWRAIQERRAA